MKKALLFLIVTLLITTATTAQVEVLGSFLDWPVKEYHFETYDPETTSWATDVKIEVTYADNDNIASVSFFGMEEGASNLTEYFRSTYAYDGQNRVSEITGEAYDEDLDTWVVAQKTVNTYANGNLVEELQQLNNDGTWIDLTKTEYDYNGDDLVSEERYYYLNYTTFTLEPETKYEYTYDDGELVQVLESEYDATTQDYEISTRQTNTRSGNTSTILSEAWVSGAWQNDYRDIRTFDNGDKYPSTTVSENWDSGSSNWVSDYRETATFGNLSYPEMILTEDWMEGTWQPADRITFTYRDNLGLAQNDLSEIKIYPNPFTENFTISNPQNGAIENVQIYDQLGRSVFVSQRNQNRYDLSQLTSGSYMITIKTSEGSESRNIIKR